MVFLVSVWVWWCLAFELLFGVFGVLGLFLACSFVSWFVLLVFCLRLCGWA